MRQLPGTGFKLHPSSPQTGTTGTQLQDLKPRIDANGRE